MEFKKLLSKQDFGAAKEILLSYKLIIFLIVILAMLAYVAAMFYLFAWQVEVPADGTLKVTTIDQTVYKKVADEFKQREENFSQEESKSYENPFQ